MFPLLMWFNPRAVMRYYINQPHPFWTHVSLIALLSLCYMIQLSLFILAIDTIPSDVIFSLKGAKVVFWVYLLLIIVIYVVLQFLSLFIWKVVHYFKGKGSLIETRMALLWTFISFSPLGFFFLLFQFTFRYPSYFIDLFAFVGAVTNIIYGFIVLLKSFAEIHKISMWNILVSFLIVIFFLGLIVRALMIVFPLNAPV